MNETLKKDDKVEVAPILTDQPHEPRRWRKAVISLASPQGDSLLVQLLMVNDAPDQPAIPMLRRGNWYYAFTERQWFEIRRREVNGRPVMKMWVIYGPNTLDHPGKFVAREWLLMTSGNTAPQQEPGQCVVVDGLDEARALVPAGLVRVPREEEDMACIVETWI